jgi:integrase
MAIVDAQEENLTANDKKTKGHGKKLTDKKVESLRPKTKRYIEWDGRTGLGVRVSPFGKKTFIFMYRFNGKARMMTLGTYGTTAPDISLADAGQIKADAVKDIKQGIDPGQKEITKKRLHREAPTVAELVDEYIENWAKKRKRSWAEDERILKLDIVPVWGNRKAKSIIRRDVITLLNSIVERDAPIQANRTLAVVRKMFNFAVGQDIIPATPCAEIQAPAPEKQRDRVLADAEIKTLWDELPKARMTELTRLAIKLQLATAQRIGEVAAAEWSEIDLDGNIWTIPGEKTKNGLPHRVPLSPMALELLQSIRIESGASQYLFPSPREAVGHMSPSAMGRAMYKAILEKKEKYRINLKDVTPHDLRRTAASKMTEAGIPRLVVSKVLNHAETGITAVYDRHGYDNEKRQALDTWARKLDSIITGKGEGKVIPIQKGAGKKR